jgi:hydroxypyruvate isomerase
MISRRSILKSLAAVSIASPVLAAGERVVKNGRIRQSVVPWCFKPVEIPDLAKAAAAMGLASVELCDAKHWPMLKELGLTCAIATSHGFTKGFAHREEWAEC